jgi:hypothetical protein
MGGRESYIPPSPSSPHLRESVAGGTYPTAPYVKEAHGTRSRYRRCSRGFARDKPGYQKQVIGASLDVAAAEADLGSLSAAHPAFTW